MRTWPADLGGRTPPPPWRFLTFTQNFQLQPGTSFSLAWSLCIEEQFYLLLPLVVLLAKKLRGGVLWSHYGREDFGQISAYYPHVYYATLCRIDEFLPGVTVAVFKHKHPALWQSLMLKGPAVLIAALASCAVMLGLALTVYQIDDYGYGFFMTTFGYSLLAASFALLVVAALSPASALHKLRVPGAPTLALWPYAIYLSHKAIANVLMTWLKPMHWTPMAMLLIITAACTLGGAILHALVEAPFMRLRERVVPSNFRP